MEAGATITAATGFLRAETSSAANFIWSVALPLIYGPWLSTVTTTLSDGDDTIYNAIDSAVSGSLCGVPGLTTRRRCFWHRVLQKYSIIYSKYSSSDGGVGDAVRGWLCRICFSAESENAFIQQWEQMMMFIADRLADATCPFTQAHSATLAEFLDSLFIDRKFIGNAFHRTRSFLVKSTTRSEGENSTFKRNYRVNNATPI